MTRQVAVSVVVLNEMALPVVSSQACAVNETVPLKALVGRKRTLVLADNNKGAPEDSLVGIVFQFPLAKYCQEPADMVFWA